MAIESVGSGSVLAISRPHPRLLTYWLLASLLTGPGFPFVFAYRLLRYRTLRYRFDEEGVSMSWGALFHREVALTYWRIQDIHLASNVLERYFGLARIQIQTASGRAAAEMTLEGLLEYERVRDFLYARMHGAQAEGAPASPDAGTGGEGELVRALDEVSEVLDAVRRHLEGGGG